MLAARAAGELRVSPECLFDRDRRGRVVLARQVTMAVLRRQGYSLTEIGEAFGRSHATVLHADRMILARAAADQHLADLLTRIAEGLNDQVPAGAEPLEHSGQPALSQQTVPSRLLSEVTGRDRTRDGRTRRVVLRVSLQEAAAVLAARAAGELRISPECLFDRDRRASVVLARQLVMAALRREGYSLTNIGKAFGRTHATVLSADRTILARAAADPHIADLLASISEGLSAPLLAVPRERPSCQPAPRRAVPRRRAAPRRLLSEVVGRYDTAQGGTRRVVLTVRDGHRVLLDCGSADERVIERFVGSLGLLEVVAIAGGYLDEARRLGRPVVATPVESAK